MSNINNSETVFQWLSSQDNFEISSELVIANSISLLLDSKDYIYIVERENGHPFISGVSVLDVKNATVPEKKKHPTHFKFSILFWEGRIMLMKNDEVLFCKKISEIITSKHYRNIAKKVGNYLKLEEQSLAQHYKNTGRFLRRHPSNVCLF